MNFFGSFQTRILVVLALALIVMNAITLALIFWITQNNVSENMGLELMRIAAVEARNIDGDMHEEIRSMDDKRGAAFQLIRTRLRSISQILEIEKDQVYTMRRFSNDQMQFVVMGHAKPFIGDPYPMTAAMRTVLKENRPVATGIYTTQRGVWISGLAPIHNSQGKLVGILHIDRTWDAYQRKVYILVGRIALGLFVITILVWMLTFIIVRRTNRPLRIISNRVKQINEVDGDLTVQIGLEGDDEIAAVSSAVDTFIARTAGTIREMKNFATVVLSTVDEMRQISDTLQSHNMDSSKIMLSSMDTNQRMQSALQDVTDSVSRQSKLIDSAAPTLRTLLEFITSVEDSAIELSENLSLASESVQAGRKTIQEMTSSTEKINSSSEQIQSIVKIIEEIAERIQLLALNASIESARAGEHGRGFAVVAEEISRLSDNTAIQTKDIMQIARQNREFAREAALRTQESNEQYNRLAEIMESSQEQTLANTRAAREQKEPAHEGIETIRKVTLVTQDVQKQVQAQRQETNAINQSMDQLTDLNDRLVNLSLQMRRIFKDLDKQTNDLSATLDRFSV